MKVIDLLNKIANGEEVPKKIKHWKEEYERDESGFIKYESKTERNLCLDLVQCLNDEIEIIEDKEDINIQDIKELTYKGEKIGYGTTEQFVDDIDDYCSAINSAMDSMGIKINEILRAVKYLEKTKEDK